MSVTIPTGVLVLFGLLMLVFTGALRYVDPPRLRAAAAWLTARATRARC